MVTLVSGNDNILLDEVCEKGNIVRLAVSTAKWPQQLAQETATSPMSVCNPASEPMVARQKG